MMGMRVSFDIDYSSLRRYGEPGQRYRLPLSRTADFEDPGVGHEVDRSRLMLPGSQAGTWHLNAQVVVAGGLPSMVLAP